MSKSKKGYERPEISKVKLVVREAVLQDCKVDWLAPEGPYGECHWVDQTGSTCKTVGS